MRGHQYKSRLDAKSAADGIKLANENALALLEDAQLLFDNQRYERSVALSILSIEESGKPSIIRAIILTDDPKELKKEWQNYRKHTEKNASWILPDLISKGASKLEELRPLFDKNSDHNQTLDNLKQLSFYTDVFSSKKWSTPKKVADKEIAESILKVAKIMSQKSDNGLDSIKGLELWIKHLKPIWKQEMFKMKEALINCYNEAEEIGIIEKGKTKEMINFLI